MKFMHTFSNPKNEQGRTMVEMLAVLSIIAILALGVISIYRHLITSLKVQNTAKMIKTVVLDRQNSAIASINNRHVMNNALEITDGTPGNFSPYFWVETTIDDEDVCEGLKESDMIGAEFVMVNDNLNGACPGKLAFYFKKDVSNNINITYTDNEGKMHFCPAHATSCEDANTPLSCESGYELLWNSCITPPQVCTTDLNCTVCGKCDTETGYCKGDCAIPEPNLEAQAGKECGTNQCMVYDTNSQTCQNECTRVEYLESTGTQWIDTGIYLTNNYSVELDYQLTVAVQSRTGLFGGLKTGTGTGRYGFLLSPSNSYLEAGYAASNVYYQLGLPDTNRHILKQDKNVLYFDGSLIYTFATINFTMGITAPLGNFNYTNYTPAKAKYYNSKLWDSDTLVRDFIPVLDPSGIPAMYDKVSGALFYNAGTGDFIAGPAAN